MNDRPGSLRALASATVLALVAASAAHAAVPDEPRPDQADTKKTRKVPTMPRHGGMPTAESPPAASSSPTPKSKPDVARPPASAPKAAAPAPAPSAGPAKDDRPASFLPRAGADVATDAGPKVGASSNPFHPRTPSQIRQSNRLKAAGYSGNIMDDGELLLGLNNATKLLARAEFDYQGHRDKAIQELDGAIRKIHSKAGKSVAKLATPPPKPKGAASQAQAESDAIVREVRKSLVKIESHITSGGNAKALAATKASVKMAIEELDIALEAR